MSEPDPNEIPEAFDEDPDQSFNATMLGLHKIAQACPDDYPGRQIIIDAGRHLWDLRQRNINLLRELS